MANQRPIMRFNKPEARGPGWEPPTKDAQPSRWDAPVARGERVQRVQSSRTASVNGQPPAEIKHHARRKRFAREVMHDILAGVGEFAGTVSCCVEPDDLGDGVLTPLSAVHVFAAFVPWSCQRWVQPGWGIEHRNWRRHGELRASQPRRRVLTFSIWSQSVTTNDNQTILFIALSFGMSLIVTAWAFFRITGSAFNPAVTLALWLVGNISARRAVGITIAQLVGGIAAAGTAKGLTLGTFGVVNTLSAGVSTGQGLGIELFTTALLVFTVQMTAIEKSRTTYLAPVAIGLSVFVGHLASIGWTGAGMNPARSLGPSVVTGTFPKNAWL